MNISVILILSGEKNRLLYSRLNSPLCDRADQGGQLLFPGQELSGSVGET